MQLRWIKLIGLMRLGSTLGLQIALRSNIGGGITGFDGLPIVRCG